MEDVDGAISLRCWGEMVPQSFLEEIFQKRFGRMSVRERKVERFG